MAMNGLMPGQGMQGSMGGQGNEGFWGTLMSMLFGNKGQMNQFTTQTPGQMQDADFMRMFGKQQMQNPYEGFAPIANKLQNQWSQNTVPSLAARFGSMGDNKLTSGAFTSQVQGSQNQLNDIIGSLMAQFGQNNMNQGRQNMMSGMGSQFENIYNPSTMGLLQHLLTSGQNSVSQMAPMAGKMMMGGM